MMADKGGRIVAVTYAPGSRTGSWRSWAAMGPAKAAMEFLLESRRELAERGVTVNAVSPGAAEDSVFSTLGQPPRWRCCAAGAKRAGFQCAVLRRLQMLAMRLRCGAPNRQDL